MHVCVYVLPGIQKSRSRSGSGSRWRDFREDDTQMKEGCVVRVLIGFEIQNIENLNVTEKFARWSSNSTLGKLIPKYIYIYIKKLIN